MNSKLKCKFGLLIGVIIISQILVIIPFSLASNVLVVQDIELDTSTFTPTEYNDITGIDFFTTTFTIEQCNQVYSNLRGNESISNSSVYANRCDMLEVMNDVEINTTRIEPVNRTMLVSDTISMIIWDNLHILILWNSSGFNVVSDLTNRTIIAALLDGTDYPYNSKYWILNASYTLETEEIKGFAVLADGQYYHVDIFEYTTYEVEAPFDWMLLLTWILTILVAIVIILIIYYSARDD